MNPQNATVYEKRYYFVIQRPHHSMAGTSWVAQMTGVDRAVPVVLLRDRLGHRPLRRRPPRTGWR